jgi:hypothetical protein
MYIFHMNNNVDWLRYILKHVRTAYLCHSYTRDLRLSGDSGPENNWFDFLNTGEFPTETY